MITAHDAATRFDLVTDQQNHNEADGDGNPDGSDHELGWNRGVEARRAIRAGRGIDDVDEEGRPWVDDNLLILCSASHVDLPFTIPAFPVVTEDWQVLVDTRRLLLPSESRADHGVRANGARSDASAWVLGHRGRHGPTGIGKTLSASRGRRGSRKD